MLVYTQAIDVSHRIDLTQEELRRALQRVSMTQTGNLLGMSPGFIGMRVRLCHKINARDQLMNDTAGEITGYEFHPQEFARPQDDWRCNPLHEAWARGYVMLRKMPVAIYVRIDDYEVDVGFGRGVIAVYPVCKSWEFHVAGFCCSFD